DLGLENDALLLEEAPGLADVEGAVAKRTETADAHGGGDGRGRRRGHGRGGRGRGWAVLVGRWLDLSLRRLGRGRRGRRAGGEGRLPARGSPRVRRPAVGTTVGHRLPGVQ